MSWQPFNQDEMTDAEWKIDSDQMKQVTVVRNT